MITPGVAMFLTTGGGLNSTAGIDGTVDQKHVYFSVSQIFE